MCVHSDKRECGVAALKCLLPSPTTPNNIESEWKPKNEHLAADDGILAGWFNSCKSAAPRESLESKPEPH